MNTTGTATFRLAEVRAGLLTGDGRLPVFRHTNERITMPDTKPERPTRAKLDELVRRAELLEDLLGTAREERDAALADRDRWRDAHAPDAEAEAIAGCVNALGALVNGRAVNVGSSYPSPYQGEWAPPTARETPVGRVLLHLAARYGIPLEPRQADAPPAPPAERVAIVPAELADEIERFRSRLR